MAQYTVTKRGDIKQAGPNWLKLKIVLKAEDGTESEAFYWSKSADAAGKFTVGSVWEGELKLRVSKDPQYPDENVFTGKLVSAGTPPPPPPATGNPAAAGFIDDKDNRMVRENSVNAAGGFLNGTKADVGDFWALARQIAIYDQSGKIVKMSTKIQHEAITAMFMKTTGDSVAPDIEAAEQAVFDFAGVINIRALTYSEAAAFLESMTPPTPE